MLVTLAAASWLSIAACVAAARTRDPHFYTHLIELFIPPAFAFGGALALKLPPAFEAPLECAWSATVRTHSADWFASLTAYSLIVVYFGVGGAFLLADLLERPRWLQKLRAQPGTQRQWRANLPKLFLILALNIIVAPLVAVKSGLLAWQLQPGLVAELPSAARFSCEVAALWLSYEVGFYWTHRLFHQPYFYARIHKLHHEWKTPTALCAAYSHPLENILSNTGPGYAGALIVRPHFLSFYAFSLLGLLSTLWAHSGYELPYGASAHDRHHETFTNNYGHFGWLDWLCSTYQKAPEKRRPKSS